MISKEDKILYFQYLLEKLIDWHQIQTKKSVNDLGMLKVLKLAFFVTAANTSKTSDTILDILFNKWLAVPYGHIEKDLYDFIREYDGKFEFFNITQYETIKNTSAGQIFLSNLNKEILLKIDDAVFTLKKCNGNLITYEPYKLVELSHNWYSWRKNYYNGLALDRKSSVIPNEDIKTESKIYYLQIF